MVGTIPTCRKQAMGRMNWIFCMILALGAGQPAAAVTLSLVVPSGATSEASRLYQNLAIEFEKKEPGIQVEFIPLNNWDDVVGTVQRLQEQGKKTVFVAEVSETLELEKLGLIEPFENALAKSEASDLSLGSFIPAFLGNSYCRTNQFCGPPFVRSMPVALYNLDKLKEAGAGKDQLPNTWSELETLLAKLQARFGQAPFCFGGEWYDYLFEATVLQSGGALSDGQRIVLDSPEAIEALAFWKRLKEKKLLVRMNNWKSTINAFAAGHCMVTYYSSGGLETVRSRAAFSWAADMLPRNKTYGVALGGGNLYLGAGLNGAEQQAAMKLAGFLYAPAIQARISAATGFFPVVHGSDGEIKERYQVHAPRLHRQLKFARAKLMTANNLKVRTILKQAIDKSLDQGVAPAVALKQAQQEVTLLEGKPGQ
jgi:sn-glycerol 3-phosphate transport system substrate-binding protein